MPAKLVHPEAEDDEPRQPVEVARNVPRTFVGGGGKMPATPDFPRGVRVVALLLIAGLVAGPVGTHIYWLLGGTWGLYTEGLSDEMASTGVRVIAAVVVLLLIAAIMVVLARVGLWKQRFVPAGVIRFLAWALAGVFLLETFASFAWGERLEVRLYGPV